MGKAQPGTSKALDNAMKSKGLQKLRWYCQVCEKQCRDENGFKCHTMTEGHLRQMLVVGESAGKHIADYTSRFQGEFVAMLSRRWGTKRVRINQVYNEYIQDKEHLHMNATRFTSLTEFCKHLGRTGIAHVDETEKGWFIQWIDNSPRALAKAEANQKKERGDMDDETRQRKLIQEQIERARKEGERRRAEQAAAAAKELGEGAAGTMGEEEITKELKRDDNEKVSLSLSFKATPATAPVDSLSTSAVQASEDSSSSSAVNAPPSTNSTAASSTAPAVKSFIAPPPKPVIGFTPKPSAFKMAASNPLKSNPLKKPNPLKASSSSSSSAGGQKRAAPMSAVEQIVAEEMARKQRRMA